MLNKVVKMNIDLHKFPGGRIIVMSSFCQNSLSNLLDRLCFTNNIDKLVSKILIGEDITNTNPIDTNVNDTSP